MRNRILHAFASLILAIACFVLPMPVAAQQGGTTTYVYDDNGRLHAIITPTGEAVVYEYDAAGNATAVRRLAADALELFSFSPHEGIPGDLVKFTGVGFSKGVNSVLFNGITARIVGGTPATVVAEVPQGATTGLVTINTSRGSVMTPIPFSIRGVRVIPSAAQRLFGDSVQFTAEVLPSTDDQGVKWSVNGVEGGNTNVGIISTTGFYTAPKTEQTSVTVRATSTANPLVFGEAQVSVLDPAKVQFAFAASVSVSRGANVETAAITSSVSVQSAFAPESQGANTAPVSVQNGNASSSNADTQAATSAPVSVQKGDNSRSTAAVSAGVSVQLGSPTQVTAITGSPVSVRYDSAAVQISANSEAVSETTGPIIQTVTPYHIVRGTAPTITVNGANMSGATTLRVFNESGAIDSSIVASNLAINPDGTSLTATLTVSAGAALGRRTVVISTPNGDSLTVDVVLNRIEVFAQ